MHMKQITFFSNCKSFVVHLRASFFLKSIVQFKLRTTSLVSSADPATSTLSLLTNKNPLKMYTNQPIFLVSYFFKTQKLSHVVLFRDRGSRT